MTTMERAKYGAAAHAGVTGELPGPFPRIMGPNSMKYLQEVVDSGLTCNMVGRFEEAFAQAMGVKHCIAAPGCTPSLAMLAAALPFEPGDEIIVSCVTDYGSLQGIIRENYIPVFADTEPGTVIINAETIAAKITDRTRAILAVHKTGTICDMDAINALAAKHGIFVIEDCCQAVYGEYKGRLAGTLAGAAAFSFDSEKTMGSDTGGCVITNDDALAERIRFIGQSRAAVMEPHYGRRHSEPGYAFRMPSCTAAITLAQLEIAPENVAKRDRMARLITSHLSEIPGIVPHPIPSYLNVYSCWMMSFSLKPGAFHCSTEEFAMQVGTGGLNGAGMGKYYLMPEALTFLQRNAQNQTYPYSLPPASRTYTYGSAVCPNAEEYLERWIRWVSFCEKYEPHHCERVAEIVREVAERNYA
jgi:dTDP-4-amino-4,6-dideoxygalactose transaminase